MVAARFQIPSITTDFLAALVLSLLLLTFLTTRASAALQSNAEAPQPAPTATSAPFGESFRPALEQVGFAVGQIHIDRWKVSKAWKAQLQNDADSIAQDLSNTLPALLRQADASPSALDVQLRAMQNVDALYDVLVRLTFAADLTEKKQDAAMLDSALQQLETARKSATAQLLQMATAENRELIQMRALAEEPSSGKNVAAGHGKTIVVDNEPTHRTRHRAKRRRKPVHPAPATESGSKPAQPSGTQSIPQR